MFRVKLLEPLLNPKTRRTVLRTEIIEGDFLGWYDQQDREKEYELCIKVYRRRRSKSANAYFHVLVGKIAEKLGTSKAEVKNRMIALYGQPVLIDGALDFIIAREDKPVEKFEELHLKSTSQTRELNGILYRVYINMRGSHEYDTKEMAILIDGTISEAAEAGLTAAEIVSPKDAEMLALYGVKMK